MFETKKLSFGGLELALRLDGPAIRKIEKRLDESLITLFLKGKNEFKIPPINKLLIILQEANQTHGVTTKMIVEAHDKFIEEGHNNMEIAMEIMELMNLTGFSEKTNPEEDPLDTEMTEEDELL